VNTNRHKWVERLFLTYTFLLLFEGVLRKWVLPEYSNQLLIIRDPIAVAILFLTWRHIPLPARGWMRGILVLAGLTAAWIFLQFFANSWDLAHGFVGLYGLRTYWLHVPLAGAFLCVATPPFLHRILRLICISAVLILVLMVFQFLAPGSAFLNRGAGGAEDVQLGVAMDRVRVAGTFTYSTGPSYLFPIVLAAGLIGLIRPLYLGTKLSLVSIITSLVAIPISGSRTLLFLCGCVFLGAIPLLLAGRNRQRNVMFLIFAGVLAAVTIIYTDFGARAVESFTARLVDASNTEAHGARNTLPIIGRLYEMTFQGLDNSADTPLLGYGIGLGTNVGAQLTTGNMAFLLAEYEWARIVLECGPILGLLIIGWRVYTAFLLVVQSLRFRGGARHVALVMCGVAVPNVIFGHIQQPTVLGFVTLSLMLTMGMFYSESHLAQMPAFVPMPSRRATGDPAIAPLPAAPPPET
jgi:hypothetical protein